MFKWKRHLVEMSYKLDSGIKSSSELTTDALNKGISKGVAEKDNLDSLQSKVRSFPFENTTERYR